MAHEYGHARPLWGIQQLKDFWEWEKHPWNVDAPEDYKGVYPTESQWEAQYRKPENFQMSAGPGAAGLRQVSKQIAGASQAHDPNTRVGGWPGQGRGETQEAQMARIRRGREGAHDYPMALSRGDFGMYGQAQKDIAAGKFAPEEEDEYASLLRMMFMAELMSGMQGGDPPTPYTVQAGPAARAFPTMPSMMG
jgi:hypothetical protein